MVKNLLCPKCQQPVVTINDHHAGCPINDISELPEEALGPDDRAENPRAVIGSNTSLLGQIARIENFGAHVAEYLADEYRELVRSAEEVLNEARALPKEINTDEELDAMSTVAKRIKDVAARFEGIRIKEGEPLFRGKQAVDQFGFAWIDKLAKRDKKNPNGAYDILLARIGDLQDRRIAEETARREAIAREEKRKADELIRQAEEAALLAEETRLAAERARKPETIEQKTAVADEAEETAAVTTALAENAIEAAREARVNALAKPADMIRHRSASGALSTTKREPYARMSDRSKLDFSKLIPFFTDAEVEKALRNWAKTTNHAVEMPGAEIGHGNKPTLR